MSVWERQSQEDGWRGYSLAEDSEDSYIGLFLNHVVLPYSEPYIFVSLTRGAQPGSAVGSRLCNCVTPSLTVDWPYLMWVPMYK